MGDFSFAGALRSAQHGEYRAECSSYTSVVGCIGYGGTIVGTLRDGVPGCLICTLGGGARIGVGLDLSIGAISGVGGLVDGTAALNRLVS